MTTTHSRLLTLLLTVATLPITSGGAVAQQGASREIVFAPRVSPIHLIARPDEYHGKVVRVEGVLHVNFEDSALYVSKDEADHLGANAVWITYAADCQFSALDSKKRSRGQAVNAGYFNGRRVSIWGRFNKDLQGHMNAYAGTLEQVSIVQESRRWYDGAKEL